MIKGHSPPSSAPRPIATCEAMALFFCVRMTRPPEPRLHPPSPRAPYGNAPHGSAWHGGLQACTPPNGAPGPLGQERAAQRTRRPTRIAGTCRTASAGGAGDKLALQWEEPGTHLLSNRRCRRHTCSPRIAGARCTAAAPQGPPPRGAVVKQWLNDWCLGEGMVSALTCGIVSSTCAQHTGRFACQDPCTPPRPHPTPPSRSTCRLSGCSQPPDPRALPRRYVPCLIGTCRAYKV